MSTELPVKNSKGHAWPSIGFSAILAFAATVLLVIGGGWMMMSGKNQPQRVVLSAKPQTVPEQAAAMRSVVLPQYMLAQVPAELAMKLKGDFSSAGITLIQSASGAGVSLEADLPENLSADALRLFERYNLLIPADRKLHIEIRPQAGQH